MNRNKIANKQNTRLNVITISIFCNFVTKHYYINLPTLSNGVYIILNHICLNLNIQTHAEKRKIHHDPVHCPNIYNLYTLIDKYLGKAMCGRKR